MPQAVTVPVTVAVTVTSGAVRVTTVMELEESGVPSQIDGCTSKRTSAAANTNLFFVCRNFRSNPFDSPHVTLPVQNYHLKRVFDHTGRSATHCEPKWITPRRPRRPPARGSHRDLVTITSHASPASGLSFKLASSIIPANECQLTPCRSESVTQSLQIDCTPAILTLLV